jgi:hypothetical protein
MKGRGTTYKADTVRIRMPDKIWRVTGKIKVNGVVTEIDDIFRGKNENEVKRELNSRVDWYKDKKLFSKKTGSPRSVGKPYDLKIVEDKSGHYK